MNLRDLAYLCAVTDACHFGRAAERCNVSQPTLSGQIRKLEEELQVALFERTNKSVRPTEVGLRISAVARHILDEAAHIRRIAESHRDPLAGAVRIGLIPTVAPSLIPRMLTAARRDMPDLSPVFTEDLTANLTAMLRDGRLDIAVLATEPDGPDLAETLLYDEAFLAAFPRGHRLEGIPDIRVGDIDPEELLLLSEGHCFRDQALSFCGLPERRDDTGTRATSMETLLNLVASGVGMTLVPALASAGTRLADAGIALRPFGSAHGAAAIGRTVRLVYRATTPRRALVDALAGGIRADLPKAVRPRGGDNET